jgi:hypothetical protein
MLDRFWQQYPQGSIISTLVSTEGDRYVVSTTIYLDGLPLVNGLAAATDVAEAEDLARDRALSLLPMAIDEIAISSKIPSVEIEPPIEAKIPLPTTPPQAIAVTRDKVNFAEIAFEINKEMNRLKWSKETGRACTIELYNKTSCSLLTDEELIGFLEHLKQLSPS